MTGVTTHQGWPVFDPGERDFEQGVVFSFECIDGGGVDRVIVFRRCPKCGRYLRVHAKAAIIINGLDEVLGVTGFSCSRCGVVQPLWDRAA